MGHTESFTEEQRSELQAFAKRRGCMASEARRAQGALIADEKLWGALFSAGLSRSQAYHWRRQYLNGGAAALEEKRTNRRKRLLGDDQRKLVKAWLDNTTPRDHGYDTDFWSTAILAEIIALCFGVAYASKTSYYLIFKQCRFSYHLPSTHGERACPEEVAAWQEATKPVLEQAFADQNTVVLCEDEIIVSTKTTTQRVWLPAGQSPAVLDTNETREQRDIYGFLNLKTGQESAFKFRSQNMYDTAQALQQIRSEYPGKHILLLWDGAPSHRGGAAQDQIAADGHITEYRFPGYSPELNPQEHVWKAARAAITHNRHIRDIDKVTDEVVCHLVTAKFPYELLGFCPGS